MAQPLISPLLAVPNEVLYEIAQHLPQRDQISLQYTCRAFYLPLRSLLISKYKDNILIFAAEKNHLNLLITALAAGANITYCGRPIWNDIRNGTTALHRAAAGGHTAVITELLRHNPPLEYHNGNNETPLLTAAINGHQEAVDLLLAAGCSPNAVRNFNITLLLAAITSNLTATATAFIAQTTERELTEAIKRNRLSIVELMFSRGITATIPPPLHIAASTTVDLVKLCLAHNAPINKVDQREKNTPLSVAAAHGKLDIAEYLLTHGANPNTGPKKYCPIMTAAYRGHTDIVKLLLAHGVDLTSLRNPHADVLVSACERAPPGLVALLLDAGQGLKVDGNNDDPRKQGPLHVAAECGNVGIIKLLLERGAKVDARRGPKWETPLQWAARALEKEAVEALLEGGADTQLVCNGATALLMANRSWGSVEGRGQTMAALVRGGADINELGTKSRAVVNKIFAEEREKKALQIRKVRMEEKRQCEIEKLEKRQALKPKKIVVLKVRTPIVTACSVL